VKLVKNEGKSYWSRLQTEPPALFLSGITAPYAHPYAFLSEFLSGSRANWGHFASRAYDVAAEAGRIADAERVALDEECAVIPLYFRKTASLVAKGWRGFYMNPMTYVYLKDVEKKPVAVSPLSDSGQVTDGSTGAE
jgi:ABC-type oligopeptide transport system substrate-binding subunit